MIYRLQGLFQYGCRRVYSGCARGGAVSHVYMETTVICRSYYWFTGLCFVNATFLLQDLCKHQRQRVLFPWLAGSAIKQSVINSWHGNTCKFLLKMVLWSLLIGSVTRWNNLSCHVRTWLICTVVAVLLRAMSLSFRKASLYMHTVGKRTISPEQ